VGDDGAFTVTILRNDDVNGVFTFALDTLVVWNCCTSKYINMLCSWLAAADTRVYGKLI